MSASLVGSEMCIRDRIRDLHEKYRETHPAGASGTHFEAVPGPAEARRWSCLLYTSDAADDM
eukprot:14414315-Alexandrium_andersonii.AAC.1